MKKFFNILLLLLTINLSSQIRNGYYIPDSLIRNIDNDGSYKVTAGSCASPNGGMNVIGAPPASYAVLQAGGYCNPAAYGKNGTVCWSFTPTQGSVTINSGYSSTGCAGVGFGPFTLYQCSPSCLNMGSGLSFTVTIGQCYTWCMTYTGIGGGCTFNDFCPYYQQFGVLPIELSYFAGSNQGHINILQWKTETEKNNDYFVLEISNDALNWTNLTTIKGNGNSSKSITYSYNHKDFNNIINYYRLKQVDYNGVYKYHGIIAINNVKNIDIKIVRILNILGQEISSDYDGIKIIYYSDNTIVKQY